MPFSPPPSRPTPEVSLVRLLTAAGTGTFLFLLSVNSYLLLSSESLTKVIHIHCRKLSKRYESMKIISSFRIKPQHTGRKTFYGYNADNVLFYNKLRIFVLVSI